MQRGGWRDEVDLIVAPRLSHAIFLGKDWLRKWNPLLDWVTGELTIGEGRETWKCKGDGEGEQEEDWVVSAVSARRSVRKGRKEREQARWLFVRKAGMEGEGGSLPEGLREFDDVFEEAGGVETQPAATHKIRLLPDAVPARARPFRFTETQKGELKEQILKLIEKGWIRPSASPWGAPVLLVPKKDGTWRFCVDYRGLNAVTVRDGYPLPRIEDLMRKVGRAACFSKMDLQSGFHQVPMEEGAVEYTAFSLPEAVEG